MEEQLITFETAKLAKEKGFDGMCYGGYYRYNTDKNPIWLHTDGTFKSLSYRNRSTITKDITLAPTQSLLQKWLRKIHIIHVEVIWLDTLSDIYVYRILTVGYGIRPDSIHYSSYEEALEAGLIEALKII
jgi:hypothetical protein